MLCEKLGSMAVPPATADDEETDTDGLPGEDGAKNEAKDGGG